MIKPSNKQPRSVLFLVILGIILVSGCNHQTDDDSLQTPCFESTNDSLQCLKNGPVYLSSGKALLATRFKSLDNFKQTVSLVYSCDNPNLGYGLDRDSKVILSYESDGHTVVSELELGISQGDITSAQTGDIWDKTMLIVNSPNAVRFRVELSKIYMLARRRPRLFGEGDVAFYDLALATTSKITSKNLAFRLRRDSSEKGYINTFNHISAQVLITALFSEEIADFIADVHERYHMPELSTGKFTTAQLVDTLNYPIDNYVDMINNEIGQDLGNQLKRKYNLTPETVWTPGLTAKFLNDLQEYYVWALGIGMHPFNPDEDFVVKLSRKINTVQKGGAYYVN